MQSMNKRRSAARQEGKKKQLVLLEVIYDASSENDCVIMKAKTEKGVTLGCGDSLQVAYEDICCGLKSLGHELDELSISLLFETDMCIPASIILVPNQPAADDEEQNYCADRQVGDEEQNNYTYTMACH